MLEQTIDLIRAAHRERIFAMEQRKRSDLALGAYLRLYYGWRRIDEVESEEKKDVREANSLAMRRAGDVIDHAEYLVKVAERRAENKKVLLKEVPEPEGWGLIGDLALASVQARSPFNRLEDDRTREMERLAKTLPVWSWAESVRGFGPKGLAVIIGVAGNLANYPDDGKLRKRMGLAVIDGARQGNPGAGAGKEDWIKHGYSPRKRSLMWNVGEALIKGNGRDGYYYRLYLERKEIEREHAEARGLSVRPQAEIPKKDADLCMSLGHVHNRAKRYVEQRLLKHLRAAWIRGATDEVSKNQSSVAPREAMSSEFIAAS